MLNIREKENELFLRWKNKLSAGDRRKFVEDGIVDEDLFLNSNPKIVFILKEANAPKPENMNLRSFLYDGAKAATWNNITRWAYGIRCVFAGDTDIALPDANNDFRKEQLRSICMMNIKKTYGQMTANNKELKKFQFEYNEFLSEQINLYNADIIVCCGNGVKYPLNPEICRSGVYDNKTIIFHRHPQARGISTNNMFYEFIEKVRYIKKDF